ncbi:MAG: nucleotidyl transferase AbiEii/AbiGii toxin family protein [Bacteroidales bacterium]|nr:nucleotidyl transferase AbiEii/AbiGii toxin family protein [Bacteroidales bacterium]MCF8333797.1 nucleotidyl transferase AbiEii/AbiGii toxin family protein [Bacteroidales bacterium]
MISENCLSIDWINKVSARNKDASKMLLEKVIRALLLVEGLAESKLDFVFKGGSALMLLLKSNRRLSIDIDIILEEKTHLDKIFDELVYNKHFTHYEVQQRKTDSKINKEHYKFYFEAIHKTGMVRDYVMLDIHYQKTPYLNLVEIPIDSPFLEQTEIPVVVKVPDFENIMGDKLTAFAPETTGIPYEKGSSSSTMEIIKQLYDIGSIFDYCYDVKTISNVFSVIATEELAYRELDLEMTKVLDDIINTSITLSTRGMEGSANFSALQIGIKQIKEFIFSESFHIEKAITSAAKAAYVATLIKKEKTDIEKYTDPLIMRNWEIKQPFYTRLNKLKKSNPEAFFYWYKVYEVQKE